MAKYLRNPTELNYDSDEGNLLEKVRLSKKSQTSRETSTTKKDKTHEEPGTTHIRKRRNKHLEQVEVEVNQYLCSRPDLSLKHPTAAYPPTNKDITNIASPTHKPRRLEK
ncbi:hypothetical protein RUM44_009877 [Polyplax serrata]|uniref:Uncharacterized protein n=1 Tax=Polyplax serrata TaxID=468196 RepID=A0ABR1ATY8_POLSC